ncbi:MAG TPA: delta-60 repeat domain-containing protein, partial [Hyalangium sp.]|nr:delta-60 repeat domain-containing protein [Hyalangium sp.]
FYGAAVSSTGDRLAAAGYIAGGGQDDDALLFLQPTAGGAEFVQPVPVSETENDRFWAVAFDSAGKAYAAGFLAQAGDNRMIVVRFNPDGTRDTSFGTNGVASHNVIAAGTDEMARGIVIQSDGKVVIAGTVEKK